MAESQGFEPWVRDYRTHDFQSYVNGSFEWNWCIFAGIDGI